MLAPPPPPGVSVSTIAATTTATTGRHMLKFEGYKLIKRMHHHGKYVASCAFEAAGHTWRIRCYPNGIAGEGYGYTSLYLVLDDDDASAAAAAGGVHAEVKFSLLRQRGRPLSGSIAGTFKKRTPMGYSQFIYNEKLEKRRREFLKDDCLAVLCDITVLEKSAVKAPAVQADLDQIMGVVCECTDDLCKRHHDRTTPTEPRKSFLKFLCLRS